MKKKLNLGGKRWEKNPEKPLFLGRKKSENSGEIGPKGGH